MIEKKREKTNMDNNNNNSLANSGQGNNFFSGFLLGVLVGAAVVFLLGTKKGKRLLKAISEEGIDNVSDILKEAEKTEDLNEISEKQKENFTPKRELIVKKRSIEEKPKVRRFFRGISRRVN